jgi:phosphoheptose isomerase
MTLLRDHLAELSEALGRLAQKEEVVEAAATVIAGGNGGSAAEAQHLTGELVGRLRADRERIALPAIALHADTSSLTALGNDYGFESIYRRQVEAFGRAGDVLVVFSTSGKSINLVSAAEAAASRGLSTIGLLGERRDVLHGLCDLVLDVPSQSIAVIQECHLLLVHTLVELIENRLLGTEHVF